MSTPDTYIGRRRPISSVFTILTFNPCLSPATTTTGVKEDQAVEHTLEVDGPLLPCRVQALVHALMSRQSEFHVQYITDARTLGVNGAVAHREIGVSTRVYVSVFLYVCMCVY